MTTEQWLAKAKTALDAVGVASGRLDSLLLLEHATGQSREQLLAHPEITLDTVSLTTLDQLLAQRAARIPMAHLLGRRQFYGLELEITPDVLTPRAETEPMVERAIRLAPKAARLLDLGTGSGAVAIAVAHARPDLAIVASDVSAAAIQVAGRNAKHHKVNIELIQSDLFAEVSSHFDVITANLPYLRNDAELMPEVTREPAVALFGGADGLALYRRFFAAATDHLAAGGLAILEADPWQHPPLIELAKAHGFEPIEPDYFIVTLRQVKTLAK